MTKQADIQRKAIMIELGRDLLNEGLESFLDRLVGTENAARVLAEHPRVSELESDRERLAELAVKLGGELEEARLAVLEVTHERDTLARRLETAEADAIRARCTRPRRCYPIDG